MDLGDRLLTATIILLLEREIARCGDGDELLLRDLQEAKAAFENREKHERALDDALWLLR